MSGFFEALSEFLESDIAKSHGWVILVFFIICIAMGWVIIEFIYANIIIPSKTIEANNIQRENEELKKKLEDAKNEIQKLRVENEDLKQKIQHFRFQEAIENNEMEIFENKALEKFTK